LLSLRFFARTIGIVNGLRRIPSGKNYPARARGLDGKKAFTLVELLVVIAIIAILAGLLLPALAGAKMQAWRIQCLNNERQLAITWTMYTGDYHDSFALNGGDGSSTSTQAHLWVYGGNHGDPDTLTNTLYINSPNYALFAPLMQQQKIYKCPADRSTWPVSTAKFVTEQRSYALNSYIGTPAANAMTPLKIDGVNYRLYMKTSDFTSDSPANRFLFMDVNPASICTPGFGVDMSLATFIHYPTDLHGGSGVVSFADGHVLTHKWLDPRTTIGLPPGRNYISHGNSSPGNADLAWIASVTSARK
jgi:prepilin-type N-terminal cleavage/methylation domain-containing protein/prepilin-type processing-associated H-X9-DG protein